MRCPLHEPISLPRENSPNQDLQPMSTESVAVRLTHGLHIPSRVVQFLIHANLNLIKKPGREAVQQISS